MWIPHFNPSISYFVETIFSFFIDFSKQSLPLNTSIFLKLFFYSLLQYYLLLAFFALYYSCGILWLDIFRFWKGFFYNLQVFWTMKCKIICIGREPIFYRSNFWLENSFINLLSSSKNPPVFWCRKGSFTSFIKWTQSFGVGICSALNKLKWIYCTCIIP